jgi:hypothetical protein
MRNGLRITSGTAFRNKHKDTWGQGVRPLGSDPLVVYYLIPVILRGLPTVKTGLGEGNRQFDAMTFRWTGSNGLGL